MLIICEWFPKSSTYIHLHHSCHVFNKWSFASWLPKPQGLEEVKVPHGTRAEEAVKFKRTLRKTLQRLEDVLPEMIDEEVGETEGKDTLGGHLLDEGLEIDCWTCWWQTNFGCLMRFCMWVHLILPPKKNHVQVSGNCESRVKNDEFAPKPIDNLRK